MIHAVFKRKDDCIQISLEREYNVIRRICHIPKCTLRKGKVNKEVVEQDTVFSLLSTCLRSSKCSHVHGGAWPSQGAGQCISRVHFWMSLQNNSFPVQLSLTLQGSWPPWLPRVWKLSSSPMMTKILWNSSQCPLQEWCLVQNHWVRTRIIIPVL